MKLSLLIDLDDTLLNNEAYGFVAEYTRELGKFLHQFDARVLAKQLLFASKKMVENVDPGHTLEEVFDSHFYPALGIDKTQLQPQLDIFYTQVYPNLKKLTSVNPASIHLIEYAHQQGFSTTIATNPLFPTTAILQRISWAGLLVEPSFFEIITNYEDFHFSKPHLAYYAEILARLGYPASPTVMIGNSLEDDILPAEGLGMPAFWVTSQPDPAGRKRHPLSSSGTLTDIIPWLENIQAQNNLDFRTPLTPESILAILKSTPAAISTLYKKNSENFNRKLSVNEWSSIEVVCHLLDSDREVYLPHLQRTLTEDNPKLSRIDSQDWPAVHAYAQQEYASVYKKFYQTRSQLITLVYGESLSDLEKAHQNWSRPAFYKSSGRQITLGNILEDIALHDQEHIRQIIHNLNPV